MTEPLDERALQRLIEAGRDPKEPAPEKPTAEKPTAEEPNAAKPNAEESNAGEQAALPDLDLGKYQLVRELGRGGMGVVYEARDTHLGRRVALKVLTEQAGFSAVLRRRFVREATAAGRLQHPHIAQVYDATPDYIAMQLVDGPSLQDFAGTPRQRAEMIRDAARALHYAHDHGVIHRDLKPSNILVETGRDGAPHVYVTDFGLAKERRLDSSLSQSGHVLGTPAFMAPEQAQGHVHAIDERSDVYGLGATLYACLAGRPPFAATDVLQVLRQVVETEPARLSGVDPDLETVVGKAMSKEPERRYDTAAALADDLDRWLQGRPIEARAPSLGYRARKLARRHATAIKGAAAVGLAAAVVVGFVLVNARGERRAAQKALQVSNTVTHLLADAEDHFRVGEFGQRNKMLERATTLCDGFVASHPGVAQAHYLLGRVLRARGDFDPALAALDRALELEPTLPEARFERGLLLVERINDPIQATGAAAFGLGHLRRQAVLDLEAGLTGGLELRTVDRLYGQAWRALLDGDRERARALLDNVLELDSAHPAALAAILPLATDDERRRWLSSKVVDVHRGLVPGTGRTDPMASVRLAGNDQPLRAEGWLVDLPSEAGELAEDVIVHAHRGLQRILRADTLSGQGQMALAKQELTRAVRDCDYALQIAPRFAPACNNRAVAHMRLAEQLVAAGDAAQAFGERLAAIADLNLALEAEPRFTFALVNRALVQREQAAALRRGELPDEARAMAAAARGDAERALELGGPKWSRRADVTALRDSCVQ